MTIHNVTQNKMFCQPYCDMKGGCFLCKVAIFNQYVFGRCVDGVVRCGVRDCEIAEMLTVHLFTMVVCPLLDVLPTLTMKKSCYRLLSATSCRPPACNVHYN